MNMEIYTAIRFYWVNISFIEYVLRINKNIDIKLSAHCAFLE
jgi:hypothetical protein